MNVYEKNDSVQDTLSQKYKLMLEKVDKMEKILENQTERMPKVLSEILLTLFSSENKVTLNYLQQSFSNIENVDFVNPLQNVVDSFLRCVVKISWRML